MLCLNRECAVGGGSHLNRVVPFAPFFIFTVRYCLDLLGVLRYFKKPKHFGPQLANLTFDFFFWGLWTHAALSVWMFTGPVLASGSTATSIFNNGTLTNALGTEAQGIVSAVVSSNSYGQALADRYVRMKPPSDFSCFELRSRCATRHSNSSTAE